MAFAFVAAAHGDANATSITVNKPTGTADNDICFLFLAHLANEDPNSGLTGWTQLGTRRYDAVSGKSHSLYYRIAASEAASYTIGWATSGRSGGTVATYRDGFDTATPIDVVSDTTYVTNNTTLRAAGMTVAAANSALIFFGAVHASTSITATPSTNPTTFAEDVDNWNSTSRFTREIASVIWTSSGATGNMDATISGASANKHAFAVALNVAAAGGDVAAAGSLSITGAAVLNAAGSLAAAGAASISGAADLDAAGSLVAAGALSITGAADLDATGALLAAGSASITGTADLDAIGNLLAAGSLAIEGAADLTGASDTDVAASGSLSVTGSAALNAIGSLTTAGSLSIIGSSDLDAIGQLLAAGSIVVTGAADLTSTTASDISASGELSITGSADLDAIGQLLSAGSIFITGIAALTSGAVDVARTPGGSGYPVYWQGKRRKRRLEEQPNLHLKKVLDDVVKELYGELTEAEVPKEVQVKAAKLVKPFVKKTDKKLAIPPEAAVDWQALEKDAARVRQIIALWRKHELEVEIDAEDEYLLMIA